MKKTCKIINIGFANCATKIEPDCKVKLWDGKLTDEY